MAKFRERLQEQIMVRMLNQLRLKIRALLRRRQLDRDLEEELQFHLAMREEKIKAEGASAVAARESTRRGFGNPTSGKERCREMWTFVSLESWWQDVRLGARMLRKNPAFSAVAILSLALGIAANTAIFSIIDALIVRELPVRNPEQLVDIAPYSRSGERWEMSIPIFEELERRQTAFSAMSIWFGDEVLNVEANGAASRSDVWAVDANYFPLLGVAPLLGRLFDATDINLHRGVPASVAVLGNAFWQRHFGGDPSVVGKVVRVEGMPFTVIGVTSESFSGLSADDPPEVILPLTAEPLVNDEALDHMYSRKALYFDVAGRLKDGVTIGEAQAQLSTLWPSVQANTVPPDYAPEQREEFLSNRIQVKSIATGSSLVRERYTKPLYALMGLAALILLIACINLASLLVSRAGARAQEMSVRLSLGATRWRLIRQLLTESFVLSFAGTALGFVIANWGSHALSDFILRQTYIVPARLNLTLDGRVLGFTAAAGIATGFLFGIAPALHATRREARSTLEESARVLRGAGRAGRILISTQVALSLVLLMAAALFVRSLEKLRTSRPGFRSDNVLLVSLFPKPGGYKNLNDAAYYRELTQRVARIPAVSYAGISHEVPAMNIEGTERVTSSPAGSRQGYFDADLQMVSPGLFSALSMRLLEGRDFTWEDGQNSPPVAILGQNLAEQLFPGGDALGGHVNIGTDPQRQNVKVVGIVNSAAYWNVRAQATLEIYIPALQGYIEWSELLVRTPGDPRALALRVRGAVESMGHEYVTSAKPLADYVKRSLLQERLTAAFSAFFGGLALLLASIGLYGLMSYTVTRRTREIGVRMALGAQPRAVLWMVLRGTFAVILLGVGLGIPCALAAMRLIANQLFDLSPGDPVALAVVVMALLLVGTVAGYLPSRRATKIDPLAALRYE
jgi:predicted permease